LASSEVSAASEGFVAVGGTDALAPGEMKFVAVDRERVVLANIEGTFYALRDVCGHRNAPLSRGKLIGCLIECPLHFAQFDMRTGKLVDGPVSADIPVYQVRIEDNIIYVKR
jgi:nitrite reductase/ring-hydroxylating ferredoxin subunit